MCMIVAQSYFGDSTKGPKPPNSQEAVKSVENQA